MQDARQAHPQLLDLELAQRLGRQRGCHLVEELLVGAAAARLAGFTRREVLVELGIGGLEAQLLLQGGRGAAQQAVEDVVGTLACDREGRCGG